MSDFAAGRVIPGNSDVLQVSYGDDTGLFVEFYHRPVKNEKKSIEAGYAIFENKEYIKIIAAGNKGTTWDRPVKKVQDSTPSDLQRFPRQWQAFQNQEKQVIDGLPLEQWAALTPADVAMLKGQNIHTVEHLAAIGDHGLTFIGARQYRDKAIKYLENAKDGAYSRKLEKVNEDLQNQITALTNQMQGFINAGIKQEASAPPVRNKPGRKPKVKHEDIPRTNPTSGE
jgi:hypothetical protein